MREWGEGGGNTSVLPPIAAQPSLTSVGDMQEEEKRQATETEKALEAANERAKRLSGQGKKERAAKHQLSSKLAAANKSLVQGLHERDQLAAAVDWGSAAARTSTESILRHKVELLDVAERERDSAVNRLRAAESRAVLASKRAKLHEDEKEKWKAQVRCCCDGNPQSNRKTIIRVVLVLKILCSRPFPPCTQCEEMAQTTTTPEDLRKIEMALEKKTAEYDRLERMHEAMLQNAEAGFKEQMDKERAAMKRVEDAMHEEREQMRLERAAAANELIEKKRLQQEIVEMYRQVKELRPGESFCRGSLASSAPINCCHRGH